MSRQQTDRQTDVKKNENLYERNITRREEEQQTRHTRYGTRLCWLDKERYDCPISCSWREKK